jgi:hypothetical protein
MLTRMIHTKDNRFRHDHGSKLQGSGKETCQQQMIERHRKTMVRCVQCHDGLSSVTCQSETIWRCCEYIPGGISPHQGSLSLRNPG